MGEDIAAAGPAAPATTDQGDGEKKKRRRDPDKPSEVKAPPLSASLTPNIDAAILAAQRAVKPVTKDATNRSMGFDYTRGDTIVSAARSALNDAGVILRRRKFRLSTLLDVPDGELMVWIWFELVHVTSGERLREKVPWPVIVDRGRPPDKAVAGALTAATSYWLVGQLAIPRAEKDARGTEMNEREDDRPQLKINDWYALGQQWKQRALDVMKSGDPPEKRAAQLDAIDREAYMDPLGTGEEVGWPPRVIGKLRGYIKQYRQQCLDETAAAGGAGGAAGAGQPSDKPSSPTSEPGKPASGPRPATPEAPKPPSPPPGTENDPTTGQTMRMPGVD